VIATAQPEIDLVAEMDRVRVELGILESRILPLLLSLQQAPSNKTTSKGPSDTLSTWQRVAREQPIR
jgi:hypothetical protein